ncbi:TetR/AcrR family transcriptional regulator [Cryobacterium arcticum]|uniref:TetR family transcriptional regulator n=1 Tax=Cryobacterium arcticum TaxID=670052 RepID=A0A1B1BKP6_9MICO|nr:TetR/AcrR family transcriptional regulator [Cryobacterium arcticum]ANP73209.1 TetR family transcriptional regulator [Cryobacterium arcticum]
MITDTSARQTTSDELRLTALEQFASVGFAGASLQHIADVAGYSKSSVLYHFASKEALLEAVLTPAIDRLEEILERFLATEETETTRLRFVDDFIDFILEFRLELHTFINQAQSLTGIAVIDRAGVLIGRLSNAICDNNASTEDQIRFGIALGGAAYALVAGMNFGGTPLERSPSSPEEIRRALRVVIVELLAPVSVRSAPVQPSIQHESRK